MNKVSQFKARWLEFKKAYLLEVERYKKQQRLLKLKKTINQEKENSK